MQESRKEDVEVAFKEAMSFRDQDRLPEAAQKLEEILESGFERRESILGPLAHIYFKLHDYDNAERCYSELIRISPDTELGSLGYFHTLWNMGRERDAFNEAKRFLTRHESSEYMAMIEEMKEGLDKLS